MPFSGIEIKNDGKTATLIIEDIDVSIVNAIRRTILADIPNVAFDFDPNAKNNDILVHKNTCSLHNEFLCHRIALVPLCFSEEEIEDFDPSKYRFILQKKNDTNEMIDVTTADFEIQDGTGTPYNNTFVQRIFPKHPFTGDHILLTKLKPNIYDNTKGDEIDIEARASKNTAQKNARWCPVSLCTFYNNIDEEMAQEGFEAFKKSYKGAADENDLYARFETLEKYRHFKRNKYGEPCSFTFTLESECAMSALYIFKKAIDVIITQLTDLLRDIEDGNNMEVVEQQGINVINFLNCEHTIGNLLQANIYNMMIREPDTAAKEFKVDYVGYFKPHPLEQGIVMKIKCDSANLKATLKHAINLTMSHLGQIATGLQSASDAKQ